MYKEILFFLLFILLLLLFIFFLRRWIEKKVEQRIQEERLMFQQNRLIAMGELMSNISHHWRQPLNNIALLIMNIQKSHQTNNLTNEYFDEKIDDIEHTIEQMSHTLESFTYYLTPTKDNELFSINQSIKTTIQLLSPVFKKNNITINFDSQETYNYLGRKNEFTQVLIIILNNARDALLKESDISNKTISIDITQTDGTIQISIQDNGKGIPPELLHKVFDPYFTTYHKTQGRGLALYIAKMLIIEGFNGDINVLNNNGALFTINIE